MNKNELRQMLSLVDEKYINELLDAEESTIVAVPQEHRSRRFGAWAAAAAVICICAVGGGFMWSRMDGGVSVRDAAEQNTESGMTADSTEPAVEELQYVFLWEEQGADAIRCYTWEAGGANQAFGYCPMPFEVGVSDTFSGVVYCDDGGGAVNACLTFQVAGGVSLDFTISDAGYFFTEYCDPDVTKDEKYDFPVIHIYDAGEAYELYYLHDGIAMTMTAYNCTAEEAEAYAASLLRSGMTADYILENSSDRIETDRGDYMLVWDKGYMTYVDMVLPENTDTHEYLDFAQMPFGTDAFTDFTGICDINEAGTHYQVTLNYSNSDSRLSVGINDIGHPFQSPWGTLSCKELASEYDKPVMVGLAIGVRSYNFCFYQDGTTILVNADGFTAEEAEAYAAALLNKGITAAQLYAEGKIVGDSCFFRDVSEITQHRSEFSLEMGGQHLSTDRTSMPYDETLFTNAVTDLYFDGDGDPVTAQVVLTHENGRSADIVMDSRGELFSTFPIPGESAGTVRDGITFYGFSSSEDPDYRELYFRANGIGCSLLCRGMTEEEILALADSIIENKVHAGSLNHEIYGAEEYGSYFMCGSDPMVMADFTLEAGGESYVPDAFGLPFDRVGFEQQKATVFCDVNGNPVNAQIQLTDAQGAPCAVITMGDRDAMFGEKICEDGGVERNGVMLYGKRNFNNPENADLCFEKNGTGYSISFSGMSDQQMIAIADGLILCDFTAQSIPRTATWN